MTEERRDPFARGVSIVAALGINGSLFASILLMGMQAPQPEPPDWCLSISSNSPARVMSP